MPMPADRVRTWGQRPRTGRHSFVPELSPAGLPARELEILRVLIEGRSNRQIAEHLCISGKTASVHVTYILAKLGVHSRLEAAAYARRQGVDAPTEETSAS